MATYLKGGVDYFPQETLFTPDYSLIQQTLQYKQGQYDKGFAQISRTARNIIDSDMTSAYAKDKRKQILSDAEQALKNLPNIDLSLPQNVGAATSIFQPFYQDDGLLNDIMKTKSLKSEIQRGMALRNSDKEEERNRYWNIGVQDLYDNLEDLSKATDPQQIASLRTRRFVGKPLVYEKILKMFSDGKLKTSFDYLDGQYKYTNENGQEIKIPMTNLFLAMAENDPEAMEGYNTIGRVKRRKYINERSDILGSVEAATKEHDDAILTDYFNTQNKIYTSTTDAMQKLNVKLSAWKAKADAGELIEGSVDEAKAIQDQKDYNQLKLKADSLKSDLFSVDGKPAPYISRIGNNPNAYLGMLELNKDAIDLATSLSQFGTRKVDINPIWEKAVYPFLKADYDNQKAKELSKFNTDEKIRETRGLYDLKLEYGIPLYDVKSGDGTSGDGSTLGSTIKGGALNIPTTEEVSTGSTVNRVDSKGQADAYSEMQNKSKELIGNLLNSKLAFIETVLSPNEITTVDGKLIPYNERRTLYTKPSSAPLNIPNGPITPEEEAISAETGESPYVRRKRLAAANQILTLNVPGSKSNVNPKVTELDRLYNLATEKFKALSDAGVHDEVWKKALTLNNQIKVNDDTWTAAMQFEKEKFTELIGNMYSSDPKKGFVYKALFNGIKIVDNKEEFLNNLGNIPEFQQKIKERADKYTIQDIRTSSSFGFPPSQAEKERIANAARSRATQEILKDHDDKYDEYLNDIKTNWNKSGNEWNFFAINGQKGAGVYTRALTFTGTSKVFGEKADVYTDDLLTMTSKYATKDGFDKNIIKVDFGKSTSGGEGDNPEDDDIPNDSDAVSALNKLKPILRTAIKPGGSVSDLDTYSITSTKVAGNNPNWSSYTITLPPKFITENTSTTETTKLFTKDEAKELSKGLTIYVKKNKRDASGNITDVYDVSKLSQESTVGEVELLLNANKGLLNTEIAPGYTIQISKNSTGTYKITSTYMDVANVNGVATEIPKSITREVSPDTDLTAAYYDILNGLTYQVNSNADAKKRLTSSNTPPDVKKVNWNTVVDKSKN